MKEIKIVFDRSVVQDESFVLYIDGQPQDCVRSVDIHAANVEGDLMRGLCDVANLDQIATYTVEHYVDVE